MRNTDPIVTSFADGVKNKIKSKRWEREGGRERDGERERERERGRERERLTD